jgi:rod shape-determining protein MreB and related proteins
MRPPSLLSRKIGIDLGASNVRIYVKGEGVIVNEPSRGRRTVTLHELVGKAQSRPRFFKPDVAVSVRSAVPLGERCAVTAEVIAAGARQVWLIDEPLAAAMGAGLPIAERRASAICEIGAATTEIAVISMSGTVVAKSLPAGGDQLDRAIARALRVDEKTAEAAKINVGSAMALEEPLVFVVDGRAISSNDVAAAIAEPLRVLVAAINEVFDQTPRRLLADLRDRGFVLSGGGAQVRGLDRYLAHHVGVPVMVADEPQTSVVRGTGLALENFEVLRRNQSSTR